MVKGKTLPELCLGKCAYQVAKVITPLLTSVRPSAVISISRYAVAAGDLVSFLDTFLHYRKKKNARFKKSVIIMFY